ncbi:hypothetical protein C5612_26160 [Pseudomonas frederiksbergensis]|uniref:DUF1534 domain-containing protein n=1 Tax=Pseudomonas frederiksbergensis TaxID=104087 RepID=A0A2S8H9X4_9PSED|nr:hypothetical protein C5612_26160 [Pseudomonas frederiksbergensis]
MPPLDCAAVPKTIRAIFRINDRSHALRGNASRDAPRPGDTERHRLRSHAERGNDRKAPSPQRSPLEFSAHMLILKSYLF